MSDVERFANQLAIMLEDARVESGQIEELTSVVANQTELFRRFWGEMDRQDKTIEAFKAWLFERRPYMRERFLQADSIQPFSGIRPPEPPADLDDRTKRLADQLEAARGRVN